MADLAGGEEFLELRHGMLACFFKGYERQCGLEKDGRVGRSVGCRNCGAEMEMRLAGYE